MSKYPILFFVIFAVSIFSFPLFSEADCPEDDVDCLIKVLEKGNTKSALKAAMALGKLGDGKAVDPLIKKLAHKDKYMATVSAYALAKIGKDAVPALLKATESKNSRVRKHAAHALGQLGGDRYGILAKLTRDEDPAVRYRAFKALRKLKDKRATGDAMIALKDRHKTVKLEAIKLLGDLKDPRCVDSLINYGLTDLSIDASLEAAAVLISLGPPVVNPLIKKFERQPEYVKVRTLFVLGELARVDNGEDGEKAKRFLVKVVNWPKLAPKVKTAAISKLGDIGDPSVIPELRKFLKKIEGKEEFEQMIQMTVRVLSKLEKK